MKMPKKYVLEMFIDRVSASKNYQRQQYTDASAWEYYCRGRDHMVIHPASRALLEQLLLMLKEQGERETYAYIKNTVRKIDFPY